MNFNKIRVVFLAIFLGVSLTLTSQSSNNADYQSTKLNTFNGYNISNPSSAIYDDLGWLWITGNSYQKDDFVIGENKISIQRFDGVNFYDLEIPKSEHKPTLAMFIKMSDGFLVMISYENFSRTLFRIDYQNLTFTEIPDFNRVDNKKRYVGYFTVNNESIFVFNTADKVLFYKIKNNQFIQTDSASKFDKGFTLVTNFISNPKKTAIVNLGNQLSFLINDKGEIIKQLTENDYQFINKKELPVSLNYLFECKGEPYFSYDNNEQFFKLKNEKLQEENTSSFLTGKLIYWLDRSEKQFFILEKKQFNLELQSFNLSDKQSLFKKTRSIEIESYDLVITRDIDKEIIILYKNTLQKIQFNSTPIKAFLKEKSIRAIKQIKDQNYIVATDKTGFFKLNTFTNEVSEIEIADKKQTYFVQYPRDIIKLKDGYLLNDHLNLFKVNKSFQVEKKYQHKVAYEEVIKLGDTIFKAGLNRNGFLKFSLKSEKFFIEQDKDFMLRELATYNENLYGVSLSRGVFEYQKGIINFYTPENENPENLLSITNDKNYGLLISTKQGNIYQFNPKDKLFSLFYKDQLKTSIVGMVSDTTKVVWLNTYAGIVAYQPKLNKAVRYSKSDGIYELEGNRYSTYIDNDGNILMGSFKGLHYFNPYELNQTEKNIALSFSSISFFDEKRDSWQTHNAPNYLKNVKKISLPSHTQRFSAKVSILDILEIRNYKFRYRLLDQSNFDNENTKWNKLYLEGEMVFSNLSAGNYTLEIEVLDSVNKKIGETLQLNIVSNQIFYKTWWFITLLILGITFFFIYLMRQFKSKQLLLTENKIAVNEAKIKQTMMIEIHHRIKNNLQVVSGLLSLQAFASDNLELKAKLQDSQTRIESIAGIHDILYKTDNQEEILVAQYFKEIIDYNKTIFPLKVNFKLQIDPVKLMMDKAIPLALILNELIINSYKHAFIDEKNPSIKINFFEENNQYIFAYEDNGFFDETKIDDVSMGNKIISMMSTQLKGLKTSTKRTNFNIRIEFSKDSF